MAKDAKPAAAKQTPAQAGTGADDAPPKKGKKKLIIILVMMLLIGGGAAAFFKMKSSHPAKSDEAEVAAEEEHPEVPSTYVQLGTFTANLVHEEGDRYLQVEISLKLTKPQLEEKIKAGNPEILHRVNMLLQSKAPSELATVVGKEKLASDIKTQVEYVIGFRKTPPVISTAQSAVQSSEPPAVQNEGEHTAPAEKVAVESPKENKSGIADVLFTKFIIQ